MSDHTLLLGNGRVDSSSSRLTHSICEWFNTGGFTYNDLTIKELHTRRDRMKLIVRQLRRRRVDNSQFTALCGTLPTIQIEDERGMERGQGHGRIII